MVEEPNMETKTKKRNGFTLVELMVGVTIMTVVFAVSTVVLNSVSTGAAKTGNDMQVAQALGSAADTYRQQAGSIFDHMTKTNELIDPTARIKIYATISDIDPNTRSRDVTLVAKWLENVEQTKTMDFKLVQTQARLGYGNIKVRVVKIQNPSEGISGVEISAPGQDVTTVTTYSDLNGVATLSGVKVEKDGVLLHVNGAPALAYFYSGTYSFAKDFQTGEIVSSGMEYSSYTNPIQMYPPGEIKGQVTDTLSGLPVPNVEVWATKKDTVITISGNYWKKTTDANGNFSIKLLPGNYHFYNMGSSQYATAGRNSDWYGYFWSNNFSETSFPVVSNTPVIKNIQAVKRGSMQGNIYGVNFSTPNFIQTGSAPNGLYLKFYRNNKMSYLHPTNAWFDLGNTNAWDEKWGQTDYYDPNYGRTTVQSDSYGQFTANNFTPLQVQKDNAYDLQFNWVHIRPHVVMTNTNFVPALVMGPAGTNPPWNRNDVTLLAYSLVNDAVERTAYTDKITKIPHTADINQFRMKVMTGGLDNPTDPDNQKNKNIYYLERSALANLKGNILYEPVAGQGLVKYPFTGQLHVRNEIGTIMGLFKKWASFDSGVFPSWTNNQIVFDKYWTIGSVMTTIDGEPVNHYDFAGDLPRALFPSVGGQKFKLKFVESTQSLSGEFVGNISALKKVAANGDAGDYEVVPAGDINIASFNVEFFRKDNSNSVGVRTMGVSNGAFAHSRPVTKLGGDCYSTLFTLEPNQDTTFDMIITGLGSATYVEYTLRATGEAGDNWRLDTNLTPGLGELYVYNQAVPNKYAGTPIKLMKMAVTGEVYGKVLDAGTNQPVVGATMSMIRSGFTTSPETWEALPNTVASAGPSGQYQYSLNNLKFYPSSTNNIRLKVQYPGYDTIEIAKSAFDGYTGQIDFLLIATVAGGGGGGGGGGDGL